jgi:catalase
VLGLQSVVWNEAVKINGADPDFHRRDLWDAIERGAFPEWELGVQLFDDDFADGFEFDVLDATKLIPQELVPIRPIGRLVLDRTVDNFFAETEQVAFCTSNVVRGIDFTNDPLLQGRNFSYLDTQLKRLGGPNFTQLPINAPKCPVAHFQQDGHMAFSNPKGRVNYEPNSWNADESGPREDPERGFSTVERTESGETRRVRAESFADHFSQARQFYASQTIVEQGHIADSFVFELSKVQRPDIRARMVANLRHVDEALATAVAAGLGTRVDVRTTQPVVTAVDLEPAPSLSIMANPPASFEGRKLGVLVTDGSDAKVIAAVTKTAARAGVVVELIAPVVGGVAASDGTTIAVHHQVDGAPSVLFDAVVVLPSPHGAAALSHHAPALDFLRDAHAHCKFIAYGVDATDLLSAAALTDLMDDGYTALDAKPATVLAFVERCAALRFWDREATVKHREPPIGDPMS